MPKGAERLPPNIVVSESDLHMRRLWGSPRDVRTYHPSSSTRSLASCLAHNHSSLENGDQSVSLHCANI